MEKTVKKVKLGHESPQEDLAYWLSRPPEERIGAMEILRKQWYGDSARMQRTVRIIQIKQG